MDAQRIMIRNKYRGCLLGVAVGDSTGFIVEMKNPQECQKYYHEILNGNYNHSDLRPPFNVGSISDDTQQSIQLAESLLECGNFNPQNYADKLVQSFLAGEMVGAGGTTKSTCVNMAQGMPLFEAAISTNAGNGAAMRVSPLSLWYINDPQELIRTSYEQAKITHSDARCGDGAAIIAVAVYRLIYLVDGFDKFKFIDFIYQHVEPFICEETKHAFHILNKLIRKNPEWDVEKAADYISHNLDMEYASGKSNWKIISPYILSTVMWSLYSFMLNPDSFEDALGYAINVGGDSDTVAAITGSLSGAYLGKNKLPKRQMFLLNDRGDKKMEQILNLADSIFEKRFV